MKTPAIFKKIPYSLKIVLLITLIVKVFIFSLGFAVSYMNEGAAPPLSIIMRQFSHWDSPHYIDIAKNGYVNEGDQVFFIVFFPLYPVLIRLITFNFEYINLSALIVSNVSSIFAAVYLFKLAQLEFGDDVAKKAVLYLSIFPTAYFLSAIYTEGLFFALVIASVYYARVGKWALAGFLSLFAALTRIAGLLLLPTLIIEYLHQKKWKLKDIRINIFWPLLALAGFLIYLSINNQVAGSYFTFMEIERTHWYQSIDPAQGFINACNWAIGASFPESITLGGAQLIFAVFGLLIVAAGFLRRFRPSYTVYMLLTWMLSVSTGWWISIPRYVMAMFPMFILLGLLAHKRIIHYAIMAISTAALCFFTVLFAMGIWAF
ncbi:MAG TPA: mannosyltransferase family protein [Candidatus Bathyarchaeia archaeon]